MGEPLPLATIQDAVLEFLRGRDDAALFGAQAVNAYVEESRATQDVDVLSYRAPEFAEELREYLHEKFHIAVRVQEVVEGGFRISQLQKPKNRHLVDARAVNLLPPVQRVSRVLVLKPDELIATKVIAFHSRKGKVKSFTDRRDLAALLLRFPELKSENSSVANRLAKNGADEATLKEWKIICAEEIKPADDDGY
jgi:Nucleotidyl transferase AbiEii toxin, Type IV TA system